MKYWLIWICSYYLLDTLWKAWEMHMYGKLMPDNFDGLVQILLVSAIAYIFMLLDVIKEGR